MIKFAIDENFNHNVVRGLLRRNPQIDLVTIRDAELSGAEDPTVLEWAASQGRILLTHDVRTMTRYAYDRVRSGLPMPGVIEVPSDLALGAAIEDLLLVAEYGSESDFENLVKYLPLT